MKYMNLAGLTSDDLDCGKSQRLWKSDSFFSRADTDLHGGGTLFSYLAGSTSETPLKKGCSKILY